MSFTVVDGHSQPRTCSQADLPLTSENLASGFLATEREEKNISVRIDFAHRNVGDCYSLGLSMLRSFPFHFSSLLAVWSTSMGWLLLIHTFVKRRP